MGSEMCIRDRIQTSHNKENHIMPKSIVKEVHDITDTIKSTADNKASSRTMRQELSREDMYRVVKDLEVQMKDSARNLQFEKAAQIRDEMYELRRLLAIDEKTFSG